MQPFDAPMDQDLAAHLLRRMDDFRAALPQHRITHNLTPGDIRRTLSESVDLRKPNNPRAVFDLAFDVLARGTVHIGHPGYFGPFDPPASAPSVLADFVTAFFNPQLALWDHAAAAIEIEEFVLDFLATKLGYDPSTTFACFCSGASEANTTGLLFALHQKFPELREGGLRALPRQPRLYLSMEAHDSTPKAAVTSGLGLGALRRIPVDDQFRMIPAELERAIEEDRAAGFEPFLVVATAGTTAAGAIDPLPQLADIAAHHKMWLHVDAAWGGIAALHPELRSFIAGIECADSVAWDAHKGLWIPKAAGMFFSRHRGLQRRVFDVRPTYVYEGAAGTPEPYRETIQWTRRMAGLKLFAALACFGEEGYARFIDHELQTARRLAQRLQETGWRVVNSSPLPLVCFAPSIHDWTRDEALAIARRIQQRGRVWVSAALLAGKHNVMRASINNPTTGESEIELLLHEMALESPRK